MLASCLKTHKIKMGYKELYYFPQECLSQAAEEGHFWLSGGSWMRWAMTGFTMIFSRTITSAKFPREFTMIFSGIITSANFPRGFMMIFSGTITSANFPRGLTMIFSGTITSANFPGGFKMILYLSRGTLIDFWIGVLMKKRNGFLRGCGELANLEFIS